VYIVERKHSRAASGNIKLMADNSQQAALFAPTDHRVSRIIIPMSDCPQGTHMMMSLTLGSHRTVLVFSSLCQFCFLGSARSKFCFY